MITKATPTAFALVRAPTTIARGNPLELGSDPGGPRHFLAGRAVHAGTQLLLLMVDGSWLSGRYENTRLADGHLLARFHFDVRCRTAVREWANDPGAGIAYPEGAIDLPPDAELRWP